MIFEKKRSSAAENAPDNEIVGRVLSGEREAFNTLVLRWLPSAHACAYSHLANHTEAEDATQEAFLKAYQLLDQLRDADKFGAWLIAIVRNACNSLTRRRNRETPLTPEHEAQAPAPDMGRLEMQQHVRDQVMRLEEADREVLMLHYFTGKTTPEIGELLGISAEAVRKRLQRARESLGERLVAEAAEALKPQRSNEERSRTVVAAIAACRVTWKPRPPEGAASAPAAGGARGSGILTGKSITGAGLVAAALLIAITVMVKSRSENSSAPEAPESNASLTRTASQTDAIAPAPSVAKASDASNSSAAATTVAPKQESGPTRIVRGLIRDADNRPVSGARIGITNSDAPRRKSASATPRITTESSGQFSIEWTDTIQELNIFAPGFEHARILCSAMPLDGDVEIHTQLNRPPSERGARSRFPGAGVVTVTDGAGEPLKGVVVRQGDAKSDVIATTGPTGTFRLDAKSTGGTLYFEADGYAPATAEIRPERPTGVVMCRPGALRVRVTKGGAPVPGASVCVMGGEFARERNVNADAQGTATIDQLPAPLAYSVGLSAQSDAYTVHGSTTVLEGKTAECELRVMDHYPATLRGKIVDADGKPVTGAELMIQQADSPASPRQVRTKEDGSYEAGLTNGTNRIALNMASLKRLAPDQAPDEASFEAKIEDGAADVRRDFNLKHISPHMTFRIVDAGGNPVTKAEITINPGLQGGNTQFIVTAPDGSFTTARERVNAIRALDTEHTRMGYASVPPGADTVEVRLDGAVGQIRANVLDESGKPVPLVRVSVSRLPGPDPLTPAQLAFDSPQVRGLSDSRGQVVLERLWSGAAYALSVWVENYALLFINPSNQVVANANPETVTITLGAANAIVSGRVLDESSAGLANASVFFNSADHNQVKFYRQVFTDEIGRFSAGLCPGDYTVSALRGSPNAIQSEPIVVSAPASNIVLTAPRGERAQAPSSPELEQASMALKQVAIVFKMFAHESKGLRYPSLSRSFGVFSPDLSQIYPEYLSDAAIVDRLGGKLDVKTSYLGYLMNDEESGMRFLDAYEQLGPEGLDDPETLRQYSESLSGDESQRTFHPLQEGIERFLITDINDPAASYKATSSIPVTWEMPGALRPDGGYVLYMDGHIEWVPYPGKFPMTEQFINRLAALSSTKPK